MTPPPPAPDAGGSGGAGDPAALPLPRQAPGEAARDPQLESILAYLKHARSFDASGCKRTYVKRRIAVRMRMRAQRDYAEYLRVLRREPAETDRLVEELTINVTEFLRDPGVFAVFREAVLPALLADRAGSLAFWSAGCSTGEEAYSIALTALETLRRSGLRRSVAVWATDVDAVALAKAQEAVYSSKAVQPLTADVLARYFERQGDAYRVGAALRSVVRLARFDLTRGATGSRFDAVFCRNVLIYFLRPAQDEILNRIAVRIKDGGYLVLGKTESLLSPVRELFDPVSIRERIFRKRLPGAPSADADR